MAESSSGDQLDGHLQTLFLSEGTSKSRRPVSGLFRPQDLMLDTHMVRLLPPITFILSVLTGPSAKWSC